MYTHMYALYFIKKDTEMSIYMQLSAEPHQKKDCWTLFIFYDLHGMNSTTCTQKHTVIPFIKKSKQIMQQGIIKKKIIKSK